jgi:hypothetical protein
VPFLASISILGFMTEIEIEAPEGTTTAEIEDAILKTNLTVTLRGTLRQYPGCHHWHLKQGHEPGTLELTWWPEKNRLWFKIASNRRGDWMESAISAFQSSLAR